MDFSILIIMVLAAVAGAVGFEMLVGLAMTVMVKRDQPEPDDTRLVGR
ncbi:hypothetical protein ACX9NE_18100 [Mycobacterium sp. ML4]